jgi:hypothetical protein
MKARPIEHRLSKRYQLREYYSDTGYHEPDVSLEECDPHISEGWKK